MNEMKNHAHVYMYSIIQKKSKEQARVIITNQAIFKLISKKLKITRIYVYREKNFKVKMFLVT